TLGQSSIENGTPLLDMICFAMRTEPVSRPINGASAFFCGWLLRYGKWIGLFGSSRSESCLMSSGSTTAGAMVQWIDDRRRDGAVAQDMVLDARCIHDVGIKIDERFAVRKVKRRVSV